MQVVGRKYQNHWPVWCLMDGETILQCFMTKEAAEAAKEKVPAVRPRSQDNG